MTNTRIAPPSRLAMLDMTLMLTSLGSPVECCVEKPTKYRKQEDKRPDEPTQKRLSTSENPISER